MIYKLLEFYWKVFGYPLYPPKYLLKLESRHNLYTDEIYTPRTVQMATLYVGGLSIEDIALHFNVTRTRVEMCLWKVYRDSKTS